MKILLNLLLKLLALDQRNAEGDKASHSTQMAAHLALIWTGKWIRVVAKKKRPK